MSAENPGNALSVAGEIGKIGLGALLGLACLGTLLDDDVGFNSAIVGYVKKVAGAIPKATS